MSLDPNVLYEVLARQKPSKLDALPRTHGIYGLYDHEGIMRYVGITREDRRGFYGRINGRHVAGSESRSHKFSHAYNTGRMWRAKGDTGPDAKLAKNLRSLFARRFCAATAVAIPAACHAELPLLEGEVQRLAPAGQLTWLNVRGFEPIEEPGKLVDQLLAELSYPPDAVSAILRQAALHNSEIR